MSEQRSQEYNDGYAAQLNGVDECENPYTVGELEFSEWQSGWYSGYIEEYGGA